MKGKPSTVSVIINGTAIYDGLCWEDIGMFSFQMVLTVDQHIGLLFEGRFP